VSHGTESGSPGPDGQNPFAARLIGSIRRECLDRVVVLHERHLRHVFGKYLAYYHRTRTHVSLPKDAPAPRGIEPPEPGEIIVIPQGRRSSPPVLASSRMKNPSGHYAAGAMLEAWANGVWMCRLTDGLPRPTKISAPAIAIRLPPLAPLLRAPLHHSPSLGSCRATFFNVESVCNGGRQ